MIFVYGDDSSDEKRERVSSVGVVIGSEEMWNTLEPHWMISNDGIPFHARDCESDWGDYRDIDHIRNKTLYRHLVTLIAESGLGGLGIAIDLKAQKTTFPEALDLAYYKGFVEILVKVSKFAARMGEIAKFTFDISTENEYNAALLYAHFRDSEPEMFKHFHPEISFAPAKECYRLQVADLMAFEAMKALDNIIGPTKRKRASWEALRATTRFETMAYSTDWFADFKRQYQELEKIVGFNQSDYQKWLQDKGRHDNISNRFHFLNWIARRTNAPGV